MDWSEVLRRETLQHYAGSRSYAAGVKYARAGAVTGLVVSEQTLTALVQGTETYKVQLEVNPEGDLIADCSCPYGAEGHFCKHCVAVGIAWLEDVSSAEETSMPTQEAFQEYLEKQEKATLIALLLEQIHKDTDLQNQLLLKIAQASPHAPDLNTFRKTIRRTFAVSGYLEYREVYGYVQGISTVILSLRELLESGSALETRQLTEYALEELYEQIHQIDDSDGYMGGALSELHDLHLQATLQAPPPMQELVEWLLRSELETEWDIEVGWQDYLPALGETGRQRFIEEVTARWEALPPLAPGGKSDYSGNRYALTHLMIALAEEQDDIHAVIAIKKRDLSLPYHYLEIAQLYLSAGEPDAALEWAEQGRAAFPDHTDGRLLDFLVDEYTRRERYGEAYAILWQRFAERPMLASYQRIHEYAQERSEWEVWRARCWENLRVSQEQKPKPKTMGLGWFPYSYDHSEEVRILLWEERNDEAWQEANDGGCSRDLWLTLASTREGSHPEDALRLYREEAEKRIEATTGDYSEPLRFLLKVREIMLRIGRDDEFRSYIQRLRAEYKRRRNFIKLLDDNRLPA